VTIDELLSGVMPERDTTYDRTVGFLCPAGKRQAKCVGYFFTAPKAILVKSLRNFWRLDSGTPEQ
jgi:hypothetical protein